MFTCDDGLRDRVVQRLGMDGLPPVDVAGLSRLYAAWCQRVPFDNVRKRLYFAEGRTGPLPGATPQGFFDDWLSGGTGGTCWAGSLALHALLDSLGFVARLATATMLTTPASRAPNHGTVLVDLAGTDWLVDASVLTGVPLPLTVGAVPPGFPLGGSRVEEDDGQWLLNFTRFRPPAGRCRLEALDVSADKIVQLHEASRANSPFNERLVARRGRDRAVVGLAGGERIVIHVDGTVQRTAVDHDDARRCLIEDFGVDPSLARRVAPDEPQLSPDP